MSKKRIAFELSENLYKQIENLAQNFHTNISTLTRQALQAYIDAHNAKLSLAEVPKPAEKVGPDGLTNAQRQAKWDAKPRDAFTAERPREISPIRSFDEIELEPIDVPAKPNIVMSDAGRQKVLDDWSTDEY